MDNHIQNLNHLITNLDQLRGLLSEEQLAQFNSLYSSSADELVQSYSEPTIINYQNPSGENVEPIDFDQGLENEPTYWVNPTEITIPRHFRIVQFKPSAEVLNYDLDAALRALARDISPKIVEIAEQLKCLKIWPSLHVRYETADPFSPDQKRIEAYIRVRSLVFERWMSAEGPAYKNQMEKFANGLQQSNVKFIRDKSGLILAEIYSFNLNIIRYNPVAGAGWIKLPKFLINKKAIINIKNSDNRCFGYAVAAALHTAARNPNRPYQYLQYFAAEGLNNLDYPVNPIQMNEMEERLNISINVFSFYDDMGRARYPLYVSRKTSDREIDLFYWERNDKCHYAPITDLSMLFADLNKNQHHRYFCKRCLCNFTLETA